MSVFIVQTKTEKNTRLMHTHTHTHTHTLSLNKPEMKAHGERPIKKVREREREMCRMYGPIFPLSKGLCSKSWL
jgi:hypothetical protein